MLDLLADALKLDEFLIALVGHFVNEGAAKVTVTAVKAIGLAALGFAMERRERPEAVSPAGKRPRRRSKRAGRLAGIKRSRRRVAKPGGK